MTEFKIEGPYPITFEERVGGRVIIPDIFWDGNRHLSSLRHKKGVYVFSIKPSGGPTHTPYYVGKATRGFGQEIFNPSNLVKYHSALSRFQKGKPVVFLVVHPNSPKKINKRQIGEIEKHFISLGARVNTDIENIQGTGQPDWSISGIIRSKSRNISGRAKQFKSMFQLE